MNIKKKKTQTLARRLKQFHKMTKDKSGFTYYIKPGKYTEDITIKEGINLIGIG